MKKTCVVFGSSMGNTENAANVIASKMDIKEVFNISDIDAQTLQSYDGIIAGSSTWGSGDLQDDWENFSFENLDLNGKTVAIFGLGDSSSYSDTFCDAIGILKNHFAKAGANIVGAVPASEYTYDKSLASEEGKFVGLALDDDNESEKTEDRIDKWIELIKPKFE